MYEDLIQNYNPEIHEEYILHDILFLLPHHLYPYAVGLHSRALNTTK